VPQFRNILCPVDFDQNSRAAVPVAAELALKNNASLYLLHVVNLHLAPEVGSSRSQGMSLKMFQRRLVCAELRKSR